ncbi:MAG: hypothetical protein P8Q97_17610 [Myxococcota bacterium]|nr:hypothetical protein [Myxococcota bacterium]
MPNEAETTKGLNRLSQWIPLIGLLLIGGIGLERYLEDASFWVDEAIVAESLRDLSASELFGPLGPGGNSFPRLYMLVIQGLQGLFGYETTVLRALPFGFYLAATYLWLRLLTRRLRALPLLAVLALCLLLLPTSWFAYSVLLKQYTFDVFLAVLLFSIPDRYIDRFLREGRSPWLGLLFALPCALSYTYIISLAGRFAGWYAGGLAERKLRLSPVGLTVFVGATAAACGSLYLTDIRFMANSVFGWWASCILGNDWTTSHLLLDKFVMGWYSGLQEFPIQGGLPQPQLVVLRLALLLGIIQVLRSLFGKPLARQPAGWGTRSLGALAVVVAALCASFLIDYPICSGRLVLFVLFPLQLLLLEGFAALHTWLEDRRGQGRLSLALGTLWLVSIAPFGLFDAYRFTEAHTPDDVRSVMEEIESQGSLPIHVMPCLTTGVRSLPEGLPSPETIYAKTTPEVPWGQEILILEKNPHAMLPYCFGTHKLLRKDSRSWERLNPVSDPVRLFKAAFPPRPD